MVPTMLLFGVIAAAQREFFQAPLPGQPQAFLAQAPIALARVVQRPLPFRATAEKQAMLATMGEPIQVMDQFTNTVAGVVAVDGGTIGLEVNFGAFLAVILGLFIPVVFLVTLFIQSDAQGTATTFRQPDSIGGTRFEDE
jgi:photosystem II PsbM protein